MMREFPPVAALVLLLAVAMPARADEPEPRFYPDRVGWTSIEMSASKLLVTMDVTMSVERQDLASAEVRLITPLTDRERDAVHEAMALRFVTEGLGRRNEVELLMDPESGSALQRTTFRTGHHPKYRIYRFEDDHILRITRRPESGEDDLSPDRWSQVAEETYSYPAPRAGSAVAEASSLIYLAATSGIARPGDRLEILAMASDEFHIVELECQKPAEVRVDYFAIDGDRVERFTGKTSAIRISIRARSLEPDKGEEFDLLGLKDLEVFLDPASRLPLELRGKVDFFGRVDFELNRVILDHKSAIGNPIDRGSEGQ